MATNQTDSVFREAFGSPSADRRNDFVDAIGAAINATDRAQPEEIPPLFPTPDRIQDRGPTLPTDPTEDASSGVDPQQLEAKYQRFDLADPLDVEQLENINNRILKEGWLHAREEWVHTKSGSTYVILKYLINHKKKRVAQEKREPSDNADGSQSSPV